MYRSWTLEGGRELMINADAILAIALLSVCVIGLVVVVRRLWRAAKNPAVTYRLGHKTRHAVEAASHQAGLASGVIEAAAADVTRKFQEGRDAVRRSERQGPRDGA